MKAAMSLKKQFLTNVPVLPDDDFITAFHMIAPLLEFKTTEQVGRFLFVEEERQILSDDILDLFENDLAVDQMDALMNLIDSTFDALSKTGLKEYKKLSGGLSSPYHAKCQRALETIMADLNDRMRIVCACFAEGVFAVRDEEYYDEPPRPSIV